MRFTADTGLRAMKLLLSFTKNGFPKKKRFIMGRMGRQNTAGRRGQCGFSLVELLTLIVIVGIVASLLIPVFSRMADEAKQAQCRDNIRAQLTAMDLFAQDNFGQPSRVDAPPGSVPSYWDVISASSDNAPASLYPDYLDNVDSFLCPSTKNIIRLNEVDRGGNLSDLRSNASDRDDARGGHSYEYFGVYGTREMARMMKTPETTAGLEAVTYLVVDNDDSGFNNCPDPTNNHKEWGANYGFVSGHVEWVPRTEINRVQFEGFHSERCPDLGVWVEGEGRVIVRIDAEGEVTETEVTTNQGFSLELAQGVEIEVESDPGAVFDGWGGSFSGAVSPLAVSDWTEPLLAIARFQAVNEPGSSLRISQIALVQGEINLTIENRSELPYHVERKIGTLDGEWERVASGQTGEIWTGSFPVEADRGFWRVVQ